MLLPALSAARESARERHCVGKMKQLALANILYSGDNNDFFHYCNPKQGSGTVDQGGGSIYDESGFDKWKPGEEKYGRWVARQARDLLILVIFRRPYPVRIATSAVCRIHSGKPGGKVPRILSGDERSHPEFVVDFTACRKNRVRARMCPL